MTPFGPHQEPCESSRRLFRNITIANQVTEALKCITWNFDCCKDKCRERRIWGGKRRRSMIQYGNIEAKLAAVPEVAKLLPLPASLVSITTSKSLPWSCCHYQSHIPLYHPFHLTLLPSCSWFSFSSFLFLVKVPYILICVAYLADNWMDIVEQLHSFLISDA